MDSYKDRETSGQSDSEDEEDWDDLERDEEEQQVVCLFEDAVYHNVQSLLGHCQETHGIDLANACRDMDLDLYGKIKLVNYMRLEVRSGNPPSAVPSKALFQDEKYLQPVLEDDALLCELDDLTATQSSSQGTGQAVAADHDPKALLSRVAELQDEVSRVQSQFTDFKLAVKKVLNERLEAHDTELSSSFKDGQGSDEREDTDNSYFKSYSFHEIHETMLKDAVRTDAYRDFVYDNKHLFQGKVVLDVGCGTGILSMFCAKAGAKKVIAVDNSEIMSKARQNIFENGLDYVITCVKGKIEDVILPMKSVDIIISEWMGYCLLYEAMLDSIIWARDRYLAPDGLMIPSHVTLHVAPLSDPDYIASHISFWHSVYGFSMASMLSSIYDDVVIRQMPAQSLASKPSTFLRLDLNTATKEDLTFSKPFEVTLTHDIDALDGWVLWFDVQFGLSRYRHSRNQQQHEPSESSSNNTLSTEQADIPVGTPVSFTTGPHGPETHWKQAVLLIDPGRCKPTASRAGQKISGTVGYRKPKQESRDLDIDMTWLVHAHDDVVESATEQKSIDERNVAPREEHLQTKNESENETKNGMKNEKDETKKDKDKEQQSNESPAEPPRGRQTWLMR